MKIKIIVAITLMSTMGIAQQAHRGEYLPKFNNERNSQSGQDAIEIKLLAFNSFRQDFSPVYYKDQIVFTSEKRKFTSIVRKDINDRPYYDIYQANIGTNSNLEDISVFPNFSNGKFHEGPVTFNSEGDIIYFTQSNYKSKSDKRSVNLQIKLAKSNGTVWEELASPSFNSPEYSCAQPAISPDGKWLYFASDMPGGNGGTDLYRSEILSDGSFGTPINLGTKINSEKNEMFPFVHIDGMLIFSSEKDGGLGNLDIYVAQLGQENEIGKILHPESPLNSSKDDFSMILDEEQKTGFFTSDRQGKGSDDIYSIALGEPFIFGKRIDGVVMDKNGELMTNTTVILKNYEGVEVERAITDKNGEFEFTVKADSEYQIDTELENYFNDNLDLSTYTKDDIIPVKIEVEKDPGLSLYGLITDKTTRKPLEGVEVIVTDNITGEKESFTTDTNAEYIRALTDKRLGDRGSFNFSLQKEGFLSKTITYNVEFDEEGRFKIPSSELNMEKIEVGGDLSKVIEISPIYFDLGKYNIRPDAALELDKIVKVMNENPNMVIELGAHTDSRGSASSNMRLSDKRAKASAKYVSDRISTPERITGRGYGESQLKNGCGDGVSCSEEEHQLNRRTEFIIVKM